MTAKPAPKIIVLETSTRVGRIAVALGDEILGERTLTAARRHARDLIPSLDKLMQAQSWVPDDIDLIIVNKGPGSYTGLRVGLMSAKTFAFVTKCDLVAVESAQAIAANFPDEFSDADIFIDAQQDRVYHQRYSRKASDGAWRSTTELKIMAYEKWVADGEFAPWAAGPGVQSKRNRLPPNCRAVSPELCDPTVTGLLRCGLARYAEQNTDDFWSVEPLYLRPSAAEEQWDARDADVLSTGRDS